MCIVMGSSTGFIEVTSLYDGRKAFIRSECITSVEDNAEEKEGYKFKPSHRTILYGGEFLDVTESLADIMDMIRSAEL